MIHEANGRTSISQCRWPFISFYFICQTKLFHCILYPMRLAEVYKEPFEPVPFLLIIVHILWRKYHDRGWNVQPQICKFYMCGMLVQISLNCQQWKKQQACHFGQPTKCSVKLYYIDQNIRALVKCIENYIICKKLVLQIRHLIR